MSKKTFVVAGEGEVKKMSQTMMYVEYLWLDGKKPTQELRSKTRLLPYVPASKIHLLSFPTWSFDGSSTAQAEGKSSDLILKPVCFCKDFLRKTSTPVGSSTDPRAYVVMCEVFDPRGRPHSTNQRHTLQQLMSYVSEEEIWIGFEQEYTFFKNTRPLGWPKKTTPAPQGPYYCGVGAGKVFGRDIVETHLRICEQAGLYIYGINAEVMPAQWEFQIGYRNHSQEVPDPLTISDHVWMARWFLHRVAEQYGVRVSLDNKPIPGDWNGAGMHTNFSNKAMRREGGIKFIEQAIERLSQTHNEHIAVYGDKLKERLTGKHETCAIDEFKSGVSHRGASIRIPAQVAEKGCGYFEDRRPGANANPYQVARQLITTIYMMNTKGKTLNPPAAENPCTY